jgi:hypothetical protein
VYVSETKPSPHAEIIQQMRETVEPGKIMITEPNKVLNLKQNVIVHENTTPPTRVVEKTNKKHDDGVLYSDSLGDEYTTFDNNEPFFLEDILDWEKKLELLTADLKG